MMIFNFVFLGSVCVLIRMVGSTDDQAFEFLAARCYSKCLQTFIRYKSMGSMSETSKSGPENVTRSPLDERAMAQLSLVDEIAQQLLMTKPVIKSCLDDEENSCSKQCFQSCAVVGQCTCQSNDIGCLMACQIRKEIIKESSPDECPIVSTVEETSLKQSTSQCPKNCKSKFNCDSNQICCATETCGLICLQIENRKFNLPKYQPNSTKPNTSVNIEFDWTPVFKPYLKKESPLVFILQTRSCLCHIFSEKYATPWQTLIRTHRLGVKLNTFDRGTIYQFRLAAVTFYGTNGFGPTSQNLPAVISKPPPPLPPENLIDYKWQISVSNRFRVEIKWKKSMDPFWRVFDFLVTWMVDHGVTQPDGEPLSSLTQYSKTILGTEESCTIDGLKSSVTYKIQIAVRAYWPGFGNIFSVPSTMYITTPATSETSEMSSEVNSNSQNKECSCPEKNSNSKEIKIRPQINGSGNWQMVIYMLKYSDYLVEGFPEACINMGNENLANSIQRFRKIYKETIQIALSNLRFNCRYSVDVTTMSQNSPNSTYHLCFCTPSCSTVNPYQSKYCHKEDISIPSPKEPRSALLDLGTMTYKISWKHSFRISPRSKFLDITKYRISWAPRKFEPVRVEHYLEAYGFHPIIDFDKSDVKIVHSNITRFLLRNLTRQQLYVVRIQSLGFTPNGEVVESFPATIYLPTYGYSDEFYTKSCQRTNSIHFVCLTLYILLYQLLVR